MQRSIGVTLTAIASILGSVLLLLMVLLMSVTMLLRPNATEMTALVRITLLIGGGAMFAFSAWGIATAVGQADQALCVTDLDHLLEQEITMRSVVLVGNSATRLIDGRMVTARGYAV